MTRTLLNWLAIGWAGMLLSCVVSMMAVFMGSGSQDLAGLLTVQWLALPVALIAIAFNVHQVSRAGGDTSTFRRLWRSTPGWLVFVVVSAACLTLIAELTMVLVALYADSARPWIDHVPAVGAIVYAVALATAIAGLKNRDVV